MKNKENEVVHFSFYTLGNYSFPSKNSCSKVRHIFKIIDMCQQGKEPEPLTKLGSKKRSKKTDFAKRVRMSDPSSTGLILHFVLCFD